MESELLTFAGHEKVIFKSLVVILVTSSVIALIFQRLRLALIPAFLISGVLVGPSGFGFVASQGALDEIGHLAVVLLLFGIGMELHISALQKNATALLGSAVGSSILSCLLGTAIALSMGLPLPQAVVIAMAFSLSSTAVVLRMLTTSRELVRGHGQLSLAILVTQDLLVLFMLAAIPVLATLGEVPAATEAVKAFSDHYAVRGLITAVGLVLLIVVGQKILPRVLAESLHSRASEVLMLCGVSTALAAALFTEKLGFSLEMGAFLMGFLLASSPFRHQLAGQITPLRDLFMAIFFTTLGMKLDLTVVLENIPVIGLGAILLMALKAFSISAAAWASGVHPRIAVIAGVILAQAGEFSLIVLGKAGDFSIFTSQQVSITIGIVVVTLVATPALFSVAHRLGSLAESLPPPPWNRTSSATLDEQALLAGTGMHIVIAGFGPVGRRVAESLLESNTPFTVVDMNPDTVSRERKNGINIVFGDVSNESLLRSVQIETAQALILTFPDIRATVKAAEIARLLNAKLEIVARATSAHEREYLEETAVDDAVVDEELSAAAMVDIAQQVFRRNSVPGA